MATFKTLYEFMRTTPADIYGTLRREILPFGQPRGMIKYMISRELTNCLVLIVNQEPSIAFHFHPSRETVTLYHTTPYGFLDYAAPKCTFSMNIQLDMTKAQSDVLENMVDTFGPNGLMIYSLLVLQFNTFEARSFAKEALESHYPPDNDINQYKDKISELVKEIKSIKTGYKHIGMNGCTDRIQIDIPLEKKLAKLRKSLNQAVVDLNLSIPSDVNMWDLVEDGLAVKEFIKNELDEGECIEQVLKIFGIRLIDEISE